jgi:hypothetical protein
MPNLRFLSDIFIIYIFCNANANVPITMAYERRFQLSLFVLYACVCLLATVNALSNRLPARAKVAVAREEVSAVSSRRSLLKNLLAASVATAAAPALASDTDKDIDVYFGCGCFWHAQHEFIEAERTILGRSDSELTSRAGYAGGKGGSKNGKVCYNNGSSALRAWDTRIVHRRYRVAFRSLRSFNSLTSGYRPDQAGDRDWYKMSLFRVAVVCQAVLETSNSTAKAEFSQG